jgi:outer membrane protein, multidrug efflux system
MRNETMRFGRALSGSGVGLMLLICIAVTFAGCGRVLNEAELADQREQNARSDLEMIKPPMDINFEEPLTLDDVINLGLRNNLEVRIAKLDEEIADRETLAQRLRMLPGLNADARFEYRDDLRKSDVYNWQLDMDQRDYTVSELKDSFKANLSLTWNLLDTALAYVRSTASEMREQAMEKQRRRQEQQLALDITKAYWQAAALEDALDYVHAVEKELKGIKRNIDAAVATGDMDRMDGAEVELRLKELELTIRQLQANLSTSRLELSRLMGLNQNVQYTLARPPIKNIVAALPHTKDLDIDALEEYALTHRPELFRSDIQVMIQKEETKTAFLSLFPGVSFFTATHYDDNRLLYSNTWNSVGAGVGWNLLNIPSTLATLKGRKIAVNMAEAQRMMMTVGVITQVHIALLDYAIKVDRFRLLEETYQLAANLLGMAKDKSQMNRLPKLAVTQRYLEEMAAKLRRDEAVVDMMVAHKRLCVSIGVAPQNCDANLILAGRDIGEAGYDITLETPTGFSGGEVDTGGDVFGTTDLLAGSPDDLDTGADTGAGAGSAPPGDEAWSDADAYGDDFAFTDTRGLTSGGETGEAPLTADASGWATDASDRFLWAVQMGSFTEEGGPSKRIDQIKNLDLRLMDNRDARISTKRLGGNLFNRVRVLGLTEPEARRLAQNLKSNDMEYWIVPPTSSHW